MTVEQLFLDRPFKIRNADEYAAVAHYADEHSNVFLKVLEAGEGIAKLGLKPEQLVEPNEKMLAIFDTVEMYEVPTLLLSVERDRERAKELASGV